jgi:hypothetical protein
MSHGSSKSGLGSLIGRGVFGLMSIALTATVSVFVQRSFDTMTRPGQPAIPPADLSPTDLAPADLPSSSQPNEATNSDLTELDRPLDAEPIAPSERTTSPDPTVITAPSITLDAPFSPEDANTFPATESEAPEPEADSTSRVMREFWKKLQD